MEPLQQQLMIRLRLGVPGKNEQSAIGGGHVDVDHLDRGHLLDHGPAGQPGSQGSQPLLQGHVETVGEEGHEDVSLDARVLLMMHRPEGQITLEVAEDGFDLGQLDVPLPEDGGVFTREIGAKQAAL